MYSLLSHAKRIRGTTLIETLVVVSLFTLLVSILVPSLSRARVQAKLTTCQANIRQIGTLVSVYQSESSDYVPLVFDYWANSSLAEYQPAENCWLSVALRRYDAQTRNLEGKKFNPKICWRDPPGIDTPNLRQYQRTFMPEVYACPFEAGKPGPDVNPVRENRGEYWEYRFGGTWESYHTWNRLSRKLYRWEAGPLAKYHQKYPTLFFNREGRHRKWSSHDAKAAGRGSLGEMTTIFCAQGEFMSMLYYPSISTSCPPMRPFWANIGSHRRTERGGTNALFADNHVEWVRGDQIGSP